MRAFISIDNPFNFVIMSSRLYNFKITIWTQNVIIITWQVINKFTCNIPLFLYRSYWNFRSLELFHRIACHPLTLLKHGLVELRVIIVSRKTSCRNKYYPKNILHKKSFKPHKTFVYQSYYCLLYAVSFLRMIDFGLVYLLIMLKFKFHLDL